MKLIHIHGNNYSDLDELVNPTVIELTFEKNAKIHSGIQKYPNTLDQPNNPLKKDLKLRFM